MSDLFPMSLDAEGVAAALDRVRSAIRQSGQDGKALSDLDPTHPALQDVAADLPRLQEQYEALRRLRPGGTAAALRAIDAADWLSWHDRHAAAFPDDDDARRRHLVRVGGHILRGSRHAAPPQESGLPPVPAAPPLPPARRTADAPPDDAPSPSTAPASGLEAAANQQAARPMGQQAGVTLAPIVGDGAPGHAATLDRERAASPTIPAIPTAQAAGEGGTTPVPVPPERPDPTRSPPMVAPPMAAPPIDAPPRRSDDDPRHPAPIPLPPALPAPPATAATPALAPVIGRIGAVSPHPEAGRRDASPFGAGGFAPREAATVGGAAPWSAPPALSTPDPTGTAGVRSGGGVSQSPALPSPVKPQAGHAAAPFPPLPATPPLTPALPPPSNARAAEAAAGVAPSIARPVAAPLDPSLPLPDAWSSPTRGALPAPRPDASLLSLAEGRAPVADSPTTPGDGGWRLGPAPARSEGSGREEGGPAPALLPPPALLPTTRQPPPAPDQAAHSGPLSGAIPSNDITVASSSTLGIVSLSRAPQFAAPIGRAGVAALATPTLSAPTLSAPKDHAPSPPRLEGPPVGTPIPGGDRNIRPQPAMDLSFRIDPLRIVHEGPNGEVLNVEHRTVAPIRPPQPWGVA